MKSRNFEDAFMTICSPNVHLQMTLRRDVIICFRKQKVANLLCDTLATSHHVRPTHSWRSVKILLHQDSKWVVSAKQFSANQSFPPPLSFEIFSLWKGGWYSAFSILNFSIQLIPFTVTSSSTQILDTFCIVTL